MHAYLDFEAAIAELEGKIAELKAISGGDSSVSIEDEIKSLERKVDVEQFAVRKVRAPRRMGHPSTHQRVHK